MYCLINTEVQNGSDNLELDSKVPIYIQIMDMMKKKIVSGELQEGDRVPSVREYASILKVNPNTIQRVYSELENINLIYTKRGIGKFVTEDKNIINETKRELFNDAIEGFIKESKELGFTKNEIIEIIDEKYEEDK